MKIVVPRETFPLEKRVMVLPDSARALAGAGHEVFVQKGAGLGIGIRDEDYELAGARIISDSRDLYDQAEMIVKLKAPYPEEFLLMKDAILFCMLHSEQNKYRIYYAGLQRLMCVEMERIRDEKGRRIVDQTDITGEVGVYYALQHCQKIPAEMNAVILGYGSVASGAIKACAKLGIPFKIIRKREFKYLKLYLKAADLLINGLTWPVGKRLRREHLVTREDILNSNPGLVILDLSVDFPSPIETVHPTSYANPYYLEAGHIHISIYGYPGLVPKSSARIYSNQILPLALTIANHGRLRGLSKVEGGRRIAGAVLNPLKQNWKAFKPEEPVGSRIE